jgi:hypothetical protein
MSSVRDGIIDLRNVNIIKFDIRSNRTGANLKVGLYNLDVMKMEITPNITEADKYQEVSWDISAVASADKGAIDSVRVTVVNADAENIFYIDNFRSPEDSLNNVFGWVVSSATQDIFGMVSS